MNNHTLLTFAKQRTQNQIVLNAISHSVQYVGGNPNKTKSCRFIYFLVSEHQIMYVGSTINLKSRIREHVKNKDSFDSAYVVSVNGGGEFSHIHIESLMISELEPSWNKVKPYVPEKIRFDSFESPIIEIGACSVIQFKKKAKAKRPSIGRGLSALLYENAKIEKPIEDFRYKYLEKENEILKQQVEILKDQVAWMMANPQKEYIFV
jgi:hypothetical protein